MESPRPIHQIIVDHSQKYLDAPALLAPGKQPATFRNLCDHIQTTALQLARYGIRPGDRVAVVLPNGPEMATAFLAISAVCTCAPLNQAYPIDEFRFSLSDLRIKAMVTSFGADHACRLVAGQLGIPVIEIHPDERLAGMFTLASSLRLDEAVTQPGLLGLDDVALVLHTSGTTSRPKIVPLTHRNIFHSATNIAGTYELTASDRCLNMMPLFHIHGLIGSIAASLISGASVICGPGFQKDAILEWLAEFRPTWYTAVPTIHQAVLESVRNHPAVLAGLRLRFIRSCSSSLAPKLAEDLEAAFQGPVLEAYGMTEATHQIASNPLPPKSHKYGSVGLSSGTTQVSIRDAQGGDLGRNTVGEICIRGENVIKGYENNPAANQANFCDGWLRTGDIGSLDEEGYLFIQGRLKEQINRGGEKISPREIDEVLLKHPAVLQAVAFAMPHPTLGEDVAAAIVLRTGKVVGMRELRLFAADFLADFKVPRIIVFVPDIPKGPTGKIQRIGLAKLLQGELELAVNQGTNAISEPQSSAEKVLLSIWKQVLEMDDIGTQDDFLALGGNSINAGQIIARIQKDFGVRLNFRDFFTSPTVESMAILIQNAQSGR
jgi:acyl-CoA synthetase (AMP-forming)/AMP-acid ligase II/acyl carrier protein